MSDIKSPSSGTRRTAAERREAIITAARMLFARQGFHSTGMAEIARVSQVLVGQIYRDFAGKEALIAAIVERDVSHILDDPKISGAIETGNIEQLNDWVRNFISRTIDRGTCSLLNDIMSEATRNPHIAKIVAATHDRFRNRLISAAMLWAPDPEKAAARRELADLILIAAGGVQHQQLFGQEPHAHVTSKMIGLIESEIRKLAEDPHKTNLL
jgi:AcrR family transcriptional regulator